MRPRIEPAHCPRAHPISGRRPVPFAIPARAPATRPRPATARTSPVHPIASVRPAPCVVALRAHATWLSAVWVRKPPARSIHSLRVGPTACPAVGSPYGCNGTSASCPTSCTSNANCASNSYCIGGQCGVGVCTPGQTRTFGCGLCGQPDRRVLKRNRKTPPARGSLSRAANA
jgi:hypothetical protein